MRADHAIGRPHDECRDSRRRFRYTRPWEPHGRRTRPQCYSRRYSRLYPRGHARRGARRGEGCGRGRRRRDGRTSPPSGRCPAGGGAGRLAPRPGPDAQQQGRGLRAPGTGARRRAVLPPRACDRRPCAPADRPARCGHRGQSSTVLRHHRHPVHVARGQRASRGRTRVSRHTRHTRADLTIRALAIASCAAGTCAIRFDATQGS